MTDNQSHSFFANSLATLVTVTGRLMALTGSTRRTDSGQV